MAEEDSRAPVAIEVAVEPGQAARSQPEPLAVALQEGSAEAPAREVVHGLGQAGAHPHDRKQRQQRDLALASHGARENHAHLERQRHPEQRAELEHGHASGEAVGCVPEPVRPLAHQLTKVGQLVEARSVGRYREQADGGQGVDIVRAHGRSIPSRYP